MKYNDYDVESFLADSDFILWAKGEAGDKAYFFNKWLATNPENRRKAELAREVLIRMQCNYLEPTSTEFDEVLGTILKTKYRSENGSWFKFSIYKWAATLIILAVTLVVVEQLYHRNSKKSDNLIVASNPPGQRSLITLPDGSKVNLNADSQLRYSPDFGVQSRNIELAGEAFFEVTHNEKIPFRVKSGDLSVQVLGTSFNMKNFDNKNIQVSLVTGLLSVDHASTQYPENMVLEPGDRVTKSDDYVLKDHFDTEDISWKDGIIYFENSSLSNVVEILERWYGIKISIENHPKNNWRYSGSFKNYELARILDRMSYTENFEFTMQGKSVKLIFKEDYN